MTGASRLRFPAVAAVLGPEPGDEADDIVWVVWELGVGCEGREEFGLCWMGFVTMVACRIQLQGRCVGDYQFLVEQWTSFIFGTSLFRSAIVISRSKCQSGRSRQFASLYDASGFSIRSRY